MILFSLTFKTQESQWNQSNKLIEVNVILSGLGWKELRWKILWALWSDLWSPVVDLKVRFISSIIMKVKSYLGAFSLNMTAFDLRQKFSGIHYSGYIDVGDGCWRRNVLATTLRCWWRFKSLSSRLYFLSSHISVENQHSKDFTNTEILSPTPRNSQ